MYIPHLKSSLAVLAGIISLLSPKLARVTVAAYLIAMGVFGFLGR